MPLPPSLAFSLRRINSKGISSLWRLSLCRVICRPYDSFEKDASRYLDFSRRCPLKAVSMVRLLSQRPPVRPEELLFVAISYLAAQPVVLTIYPNLTFSQLNPLKNLFFLTPNVVARLRSGSPRTCTISRPQEKKSSPPLLSPRDKLFVAPVLFCSCIVFVTFPARALC